MEKSLGEKRVRVEFNPDKNSAVDVIKQKSAELINAVSALTKATEDTPEGKLQQGEFIRLKSLALTAYEEAAMWAVKAATA